MAMLDVILQLLAVAVVAAAAIALLSAVVRWLRRREARDLRRPRPGNRTDRRR
ncbi:hypothetical protein [Propionibacterium ruminifibrarum]|uniref:hypothetical protein n=1 Tax=Propionibacterium ruminifibrarum TaxID=1962131 RepID=UPI0015FF670F|nr:hypothetical protein [Propionibacterium ruminifibrarum]